MYPDDSQNVLRPISICMQWGYTEPERFVCECMSRAFWIISFQKRQKDNLDGGCCPSSDLAHANPRPLSLRKFFFIKMKRRIITLFAEISLTDEKSVRLNWRWFFFLLFIPCGCLRSHYEVWRTFCFAYSYSFFPSLSPVVLKGSRNKLTNIHFLSKHRLRK